MRYFWEECLSYGNAEAIRQPDGNSISYYKFVNRADEIVNHIDERTLVVLECENHPDCIAAYIGCLRKGVVPILIDASLKKNLKEQIYERYLPAAVWTRGAGNDGYQWNQIRSVNKHEIHPDLALLLSTSGTTGSPRLVRLSRQNLMNNAESIVSYLRITSEDRSITSLPMQYSYGLSVINTHLFSGAALLVTSESLMERGFWQFMKNAGATSFAGVPSMYEMLKRLRFDRMELPALRLMTQAGGRLAHETVTLFAQYARQKQFEFVVMYGQTEATARMSYLPHASVLEKPESIGIPIPGGEFFLRDTQGTIINTAGHAGELVYRGKNVMMGYADTPEDLSRGDDLGGELATGDIATKDKDGYYAITGRLKRFIKIHGNRISLDEIEKRIQQHGNCAFATGHDDELIIALVDTSKSPAEITDLIVREYKLHRSVVHVVSCAQVPLTSSGKVNYPELLENLKTYTRKN